MGNLKTLYNKTFKIFIKLKPKMQNPKVMGKISFQL